MSIYFAPGVPKNTCDHDHDTRDEIRRLPTSGSTAVLVCRKHYLEEIKFRRERNLVDGIEKFDLPRWEDLEVYEEAIHD